MVHPSGNGLVSLHGLCRILQAIGELRRETAACNATCQFSTLQSIHVRVASEANGVIYKAKTSQNILPRADAGDAPSTILNRMNRIKKVAVTGFTSTYPTNSAEHKL